MKIESGKFNFVSKTEIPSEPESAEDETARSKT